MPMTDECCCGIIPPHLLKGIINSDSAPQRAREAAHHTLNYTYTVRQHRAGAAAGAGAGACHDSHASPDPALEGQGIIAPHTLQAIADSAAAAPEARERAQATQDHSAAIRDARAGVSGPSPAIATPTLPPAHLNRLVYTSDETATLPGRLIRPEGQPPVPDVSINECYDHFGVTYGFYRTVFQRDSLDNAGLPLTGSVHYDATPNVPGFNNALWNGKQMFFGDGDAIIFNRFTAHLDIIAHELTHGVSSHTSKLDYRFQSGALNESISDVFGSLVKQFHLKQTAAAADWLIGQGIFRGFPNDALRSLKDPGTAYDNPLYGTDPQPATMDSLQDLSIAEDHGGVHINSGVPNRAFYLVSVALGGFAWETAGKIWYATVTDAALKHDATFRAFADLTCKHAAEFGKEVVDVVRKAWTDVGVFEAASGGGGGGVAGA
jgi:Zn-dependent metalloprotease